MPPRWPCGQRCVRSTWAIDELQAYPDARSADRMAPSIGKNPSCAIPTISSSRTPREDIEGVLRRMGRTRRAVRIRMLRREPFCSMLRHFRGSRPCRGACFHPVRDGRSGRHRRRTEHLDHLKATADRLRRGLQLVSAAGRQQMPLAERSGRDGRTCARRPWRTTWPVQGRPCPVECRTGRKGAHAGRGLGRTVATPDEARAMLDLKGAGAVGF